MCEGLPPSAPPPPPAPPPACRDNDIPGFGSLFCILNTDAKYVTESDKEDFCNDPHYKNKCMLTCGEYEPPCQSLEECEGECPKSLKPCKKACKNDVNTGFKACKKQCKRDRNLCKETCQESTCPVCKDTGGSFDPMWCLVNTRKEAPYNVKFQAKADFCKNEHNSGKCKKSCGMCG